MKRSSQLRQSFGGRFTKKEEGEVLKRFRSQIRKRSRQYFARKTIAYWNWRAKTTLRNCRTCAKGTYTVRIYCAGRNNTVRNWWLWNIFANWMRNEKFYRVVNYVVVARSVSVKRKSLFPKEQHETAFAKLRFIEIPADFYYVSANFFCINRQRALFSRRLFERTI